MRRLKLFTPPKFILQAHLRMTLLQRFIVIGGLVTLILAGTIAFILSQYLINEEINDATRNASELVSQVLVHDLQPKDFAEPTKESIAIWEGRVKKVVGIGGVVRVKVWNNQGTVIYSDVANIIGQRFASDDLQEALTGKLTLEVEEANSSENINEKDLGRLLEIYVPVVLQNTNQVIGVYEVYESFQPIQNKLRRIQLLVWLSSFLIFGLLFASLFSVFRGAARQERMAYRDYLTGLANRHLLNDHARHILNYADNHSSAVALLYLDLTRFKIINDSLGHSAGDELLKLLAKRLKICVRQHDVISRMGGDEFAILLHDHTGGNIATNVTKRIIKGLEEPFLLKNQSVYVGANIGIALYPQQASNWQELMNKADTAMYHAKSGGSGFMFYSPEMSLYNYKHLEFEDDLRQAIKREELKLQYQPFYDFKGKIVGIEALIRWHHPQLNVIPTKNFISLAEEIGLIIELDTWVTDKAIQQAIALTETGSPMPITVNLSLQTFHSTCFIAWLSERLKETKLNPNLLTLEFTERVLANPNRAQQIFQSFSKLGINIALDDFGAGYSSLAYLKTLPINMIKIDQQFIADINKNSASEAIVKTIIALAKNLDILVLAEGIELKAQFDWLKTEGCELAQGYFLSKPASANEFSTYGLKTDI